MIDPFYFLLAAIAITVPFIAKAFFKTTICGKEMIAQGLIVGIMSIVAFNMSMDALTRDTQVLNGQTTGKEQVRVRCEHSYSCNCSTNSEGRRSCKTCYEHSHDYDWVLRTTVGDVVIDRVDRRGVVEPARFTSSHPGLPVALQGTYTNWVKGAPHSLFNEGVSLENDPYASYVPDYPDDIHDYHYASRVFSIAGAPIDVQGWEELLAERLKEVGSVNGGNVVIVMVGNQPPQIARTMERGWLRGKRNDTVVVISVNSDKTARWVKSFGWSQDLSLYHDIDTKIMRLGALDKDNTIGVISASVLAKFKPYDDDHFSYLSSQVNLSTSGYILIILLSLFLSCASTFVFHRHDFFKR